MSAAPDLMQLTRGGGASVPKPRRRWVARFLVPVGVIVAIAALILYAARESLVSALQVTVAPVVLRSGGEGAAQAGARPQVLVQAPGWVEADPYAVSVTPLVSGVVSKVLVLEGQEVEKGEVVARLIDEDARLALDRANAELEAAQSELSVARAGVLAAEARAAEVRDEVERKRGLVEAGGISQGQFARLELRLAAMEQDVTSAKSAVRASEARVRQHEVQVREAELALKRTQVRSPVSGVVLARVLEPGSRVTMEGGAVVRLYDPARLQVRVDVPISEAAKVGLGMPAQVVTEALPDQVFQGRVSRLVHEADIQRNTVQVKVAIENPSETLKPEMLTRVRFLGQPARAASGGSASAPADSVFLVPSAGVIGGQEGDAGVFVVDQREQGPVAVRRRVSVRPAAQEGYVEATGELRAGDRVIIEPLGLVSDGIRVEIKGERPGGGHGSH